ncbi:MAG: hypothetical protein IKS07_11230, partial [Lachnospiraceae bacterium]|nr:hypothetical protein [Lachnospiraceae bacterium]
SEGRYRKAYRMLKLPEGKTLSQEEFEAEGTLLISLLLKDRVPEEILVSDPEFADEEKERCQVTVTYLTGSETEDLSLTLVRAGRTWKIADYS